MSSPINGPTTSAETGFTSSPPSDLPSGLSSGLMTCFDWQNRASDYLDGALIGAAKREADEHLEECASCTTSYKHYRLILSSIAGQPRMSLPVALRKSPLSHAAISKAALVKPSLRARLKGWSNVPWYLRIPSEGLTLVLLVTLTISAGPRLRRFYERKIERSLTEYTEGFENAEEAQAAKLREAVDANIAGSAPAAGAALATGEKAEEDFSGSEGDSAAGDEEESEDSAEADSPQIRVGKSEIWRFNLKTDSPHDLRPRILNLLTSLNVPATTLGIGGIEAPGGIQFDLLVQSDVIPQVKQALEKMAPTASKNRETSIGGDPIDSPKSETDGEASTSASPFGETFTWYKNKSNQPVPPGQARLVIWLSQI